jgi:hypothetical protein
VVVDAEVKEETRKTTLRSERGSAFKKRLTEPTLLEMSGNAARFIRPLDFTGCLFLILEGETYYLIDVEITPDDEVSRVSRGNLFLEHIG